ncbi:hypothetical protein Pint_32887 [Pistacia integerrima]|uniref:Uncharacterized protein n=1 Tax=Pistacia integerrima TaxID=434235 RepID=A0ACC0X4G5_9ROSI|nr:hypothetical protein Pint_32887 [Pistacia integerrima]
MDRIVPASKKPHIVCVTFPTQGHITPLLKLAKLLHFRGLPFTLQAAEELGIPIVFFWAMSACAFLGYSQYSNLVAKDVADMENGYLDTVVDWIPGLEGIRLRDLPTFIRTTDPNDTYYVKLHHGTDKDVSKRFGHYSQYV